MRDSDQDGLRDDVETYGVQTVPGFDEFDSQSYMARYGANPAHYDLFVEVDYNGLVSDDPTLHGCAGDPRTGRGETIGFSRTDAINMASQYATATTALFPNRDGIGGISAHFDIGNFSASPPLNNDTAGGAWGGSNCYNDFPACVTDGDCAGAMPATGSCCLAAEGCAGNAFHQYECIRYDLRLQWMRADRRWLFFSVSDFQIGLGGQTAYLMQGYGSGSAAIVHESGHEGGLTGTSARRGERRAMRLRGKGNWLRII